MIHIQLKKLGLSFYWYLRVRWN